MLAAQVNARKHDNLRMTLGFSWIGGLGLCETLLLGWVMIAAAAAGRAFCLRAFQDRRSLPSLCVLAAELRGSPLHCVWIGRRMDARRIAIVFVASGGPLSRM